MTTCVEITREYEITSETVQDYKDWIDQVFSQQFVLSHLKGQLMGSVEYQDWSDSESEDCFGDCSSLQQLFSEELQTEESNALPPVVVVHESQQVNQPPTFDLDHGPQEDHQSPVKLNYIIKSATDLIIYIKGSYNMFMTLRRCHDVIV